MTCAAVQLANLAPNNLKDRRQIAIQTASSYFFLYYRGDPHCQRVRRDILGNNRARPGLRTPTDTNRRHKHRIASDFYVVLDDCFMFALPVEVARDCPGPNVDVL